MIEYMIDMIEEIHKYKLSKGNLVNMNCMMTQLQKYISNELKKNLAVLRR